jgi:hypothetical protein
MESKCLPPNKGLAADLPCRVTISFVLFNRQPSLHKMSMMCHRVKLMDYSSKLHHLPPDAYFNRFLEAFRLNLSV